VTLGALLSLLVWVGPLGAVVWAVRPPRPLATWRIVVAGTLGGAIPGAALAVLGASHSPDVGTLGELLLYTVGVGALYGALFALAALALRRVARRFVAGAR
jgi:hypothetical protein